MTSQVHPLVGEVPQPGAARGPEAAQVHRVDRVLGAGDRVDDGRDDDRAPSGGAVPRTPVAPSVQSKPRIRWASAVVWRSAASDGRNRNVRSIP